MKPYCVTFAGAIGTGKTPIAHMLSVTFGLPIHNNDAIRSGVIEDFGELKEEEYVRRRDESIRTAIASGRSFILDASIDRSWDRLKAKLDEAGYDVFVISLDLRLPFIQKLHTWKSYPNSSELIEEFYNDHEKFLEAHDDVVNVHIKDEDYPERFVLARDAFKKWLEKRS